VEAARGRKEGKNQGGAGTTLTRERAQTGKFDVFSSIRSRSFLTIQEFRRAAPVLGICSFLIFTFWAFLSLVWGIDQNSLLGAARHHFVNHLAVIDGDARSVRRGACGLMEKLLPPHSSAG
jgi:hypothetical protein